MTITTDPLGRQTTYLYDALNRRVEMTEAAQLAVGNPLRRITTTVYDAGCHAFAARANRA